MNLPAKNIVFFCIYILLVLSPVVLLSGKPAFSKPLEPNCISSGQIPIDNNILYRPDVQTNTYDMSVDSLVVPQSGCNLGSYETFAILANNYGDSVNNVTFSFSIDSGLTWTSEVYSGWIAGNSSIIFSFQQHADLSNVHVYSCYFTVTVPGDSNSANDTFQVNIIHIEPVEIAIFGLENSYCINDPPVFPVATPSGGIFTGLVDLFDSTGVHEVNYSFYNPVTGCSGSKTLFISIYPYPEIDLGNDTVAYAPVEVDAGTSMAAYQWSTGSGNHSIIAGNTGLYSVTVTNQYGCHNSDQINVTLITIPSPWIYSENSGYHVILLNDIYSSDYTIDGIPIIPGDYIGVFFTNSQGLLQCGGYTTWGGITTSIYAWNGINPDNGFETGEEFYWKIFDVSTLTEYLAEVIYVPTPPLPNQQFFQVNGLSGLTSLEASTGTRILGHDVKCHDDMDGAADLTVSEGSAPYTFHWSNGATTEDITNLPAGSFMVTVTDNFGVQFIDSIFIYEPPELFSSIIATDITYPGDTATVNLTVYGGMPPYQYLWSNNSLNQDLENLSGGLYSVTITDSRGCIKTDSILIPGYCELNLSDVNNITCWGDSDGSAVLTVSNGIPPFSFFWSNGSTHEYLVGVTAGYYGVTLTDFNYCLDTLVVIIAQPDPLMIGADIHNADNFELNNGSAELIISGGTSPYSCLWSDYSTTEYLANLSVGTYFVTVTDNNSCTETSSVVIGEQHILELSGIVSMGPNFLENGISVLAYYGDNNIISIDFAIISDGVYSFTGLYRGKYLVYAVPDLNFTFNYFPHYYPSYYGNSIFWENAEVINLDTSRNDIDISLFATSEINFGQGKISGSISFLYFDDYEQDIYGVPWFEGTSGSTLHRGAAMNIPVLLLDNELKPVAYTLSDVSGQFKFSNLSFGTYTVYPEKPGYSTHSCQVDIDENSPEAAFINFTIIPGIITGIDESNHPALECINIYPNPCTNELFLKLPVREKEKIVLSIIDQTGKILEVKSLNLTPGIHLIPFDLQTIPAGLYILSVIYEGQGVMYTKFLKY